MEILWTDFVKLDRIYINVVHNLHNSSTKYVEKSTQTTRYPHFVDILWISRRQHVENFLCSLLDHCIFYVDYVYNYSQLYPHFCGFHFINNHFLRFSTLLGISYPHYMRLFCQICAFLIHFIHIYVQIIVFIV